MRNTASVAIVLSVILCIFLVGCEYTVPEGAKEIKKEEADRTDGHLVDKYVKIKNVVRVFMHKSDNWTFFSASTNSLQVIPIELTCPTSNIKIFTDVARGETPWVLYGIQFSIVTFLEIHLNDATQINGAGWIERSGKTDVRRETVVVQ